MKNITIAILILSLLSLSSCGKKSTIHIKAINAVTGEPYSGLEYAIIATKTGGNGEKIVFEKRGALNENGEAMVAIRVRTGRTYNVGTSKPPNYCFDSQIQSTFGKEDPANPTFQFEYAECGFLQLKVKNVSCFDSNDKIVFNTQPVNLPSYNNINPQTKFGCYENEFVDSQVPFGPWIATWEVTKNSVTTIHDSTFYINENEHYYFLLEY